MDADKRAAELTTLRLAHQSLQNHVARLEWLGQWGICVALLLVPLARLTAGEERDTRVLSLFAAIGFFVSAKPDDLGRLDVHPYGVPGGRLVTVIGLFLILVGVLATAATSAMIRHPESSRREVLAQQIAATVLLLGGLASWLGLAWLPDDNDRATGPAWGLLVAFAGAAWASHSAWSAKDERVV